MTRIGPANALVALVFCFPWMNNVHGWLTGPTVVLRHGKVFARIPTLLKSSKTPESDGTEENGEVEEECGSEEECEINWDLMPGFGDDDDESEETNVTVPQEESPATSEGGDDMESSPDVEDEAEARAEMSCSASSSTIVEYNDFENDIEFSTIPLVQNQGRKTVGSTRPNKQELRSHGGSQDKARDWKHGMVSMEMNWQMAESSKECNVDAPSTCGGEVCPHCQGRGWNVCRFCRGTSYYKLDGMSDFAPCPICNPGGTGKEVCSACQGTGWIAEWTQLAGGVHSNNHRLKNAKDGTDSKSDSLRP